MMHNTEDSSAAMMSLLKETLELVRNSPHEGWPDEQPAECADVLRNMIAFLEDPPTHACPEYGMIQFAPTGPIQEIAIANGWHDRYMELAEKFDRLQASRRFFC